MRHTLDFEKTISDLQDKISKLKDSGSDKTSLVEVNEQIEEIKVKIDKKLNDIYKKLTPWHKLQVARHPERPHFKDYIKILFRTRIKLLQLGTHKKCDRKLIILL